jgi:hypothetical protein
MPAHRPADTSLRVSAGSDRHHMDTRSRTAARLPPAEDLRRACGAGCICLCGPEEKAATGAQAALDMWGGLPVRCCYDWKAPWPWWPWLWPPGRSRKRLSTRGCSLPLAATPRACPDPGQQGYTRMGRQAGRRDRRIAPSRGARCGGRSWLPIIPRLSYAAAPKAPLGWRERSRRKSARRRAGYSLLPGR